MTDEKKVAYGKAPINRVMPVPPHIKSLVWKAKQETGSYAPIDKDYAFRKKELQELLLFLNEAGGDGYWLAGPTGSGKTSLVEQVATRLNWPVFSATGFESYEIAQLIGCFKLISEAPGIPPAMVWQDGPLVSAMKNGAIFLFNEIDLVRPDQLTKLNDLLEGKDLFIEETGELVQPHPMFRFIATANSNGSGDENGSYAGIQTQNTASMDRYLVGFADYMEEAEEIALLSRKLPKIPQELAECMVSLANHIRRSFMGNDSESRVSVPMSTRTLLRWGKVMVNFHDHPERMSWSLDLALTRRCRAEDKEAITAMAETIFGKDAWK